MHGTIGKIEATGGFLYQRVAVADRAGLFVQPVETVWLASGFDPRPGVLVGIERNEEKDCDMHNRGTDDAEENEVENSSHGTPPCLHPEHG